MSGRDFRPVMSEDGVRVASRPASRRVPVQGNKYIKCRNKRASKVMLAEKLNYCDFACEHYVAATRDVVMAEWPCLMGDIMANGMKTQQETSHAARNRRKPRGTGGVAVNIVSVAVRERSSSPSRIYV